VNYSFTMNGNILNDRTLIALPHSAFAIGSEAKAYREYGNTLDRVASSLFYYGVDPDETAFAQIPDGTRGRFLDLSTNHFRLEVVRGRRLGEAEFTRLSAYETLTKVMPTDGDDLYVRTRTIQTAH